MKSYRAHVRSDRAKWVVVTIAILLVGVILAGLMTDWFKDGNPYCLFGHTYEDGKCVKCGKDEPIEEEGDLTTQNPSAAQPAETAEETITTEQSDSNGIALAMSKPIRRAQNGVSVTQQTITATVAPGNTPYKEIIWNLSWATDVSSEQTAWASGKSVVEYLTLTPTGSGSNTTVLTCKAAFGCQAIVTASVRDYSGVKATATVDYTKRLQGVCYEKHNNEGGGDFYQLRVLDNGELRSSSPENNTSVFKAHLYNDGFSVGTITPDIDPNFTMSIAWIDANSGIPALLKQWGCNITSDAVEIPFVKCENGYCYFDLDETVLEGLFGTSDLVSLVAANFDPDADIDLFEDNGYCLYIYVSSVYGNFTGSAELYISTSLVPRPNSIVLDKTQIVF